ncbi:MULTISPECIES: hypothetical protein [unclassified Streptomyces]|uniref:hypothetical protein n=1 Tax=unclassified Streptomyces TaxID=2593676 RepID=UPI002E7FC26A|nr:hypothetical protein [Streptomyces sp. NBC_00523]WUD00755.1 hypothetical protein OHS17_14365 [Streptomyces sp. NBC_00523]
MTAHQDVPYREQQVAPPADLRERMSEVGAIEFTGTCPVCHGANVSALPAVSPGAVPKGWPWKRDGGSAAPAAEPRPMYCECPVTHPDDPLEELGCGAWWPVVPGSATAQGT